MKVKVTNKGERSVVRLHHVFKPGETVTTDVTDFQYKEIAAVRAFDVKVEKSKADKDSKKGDK